jgi:hypothetical protein
LSSGKPHFCFALAFSRRMMISFRDALSYCTRVPFGVAVLDLSARYPQLEAHQDTQASARRAFQDQGCICVAKLLNIGEKVPLQKTQ